MKNLLYGLVLILGMRTASAQAVSIGVKGGIPLGGTIGQDDESRPYIVGPSIEVRLPAGFAIEADALYRRIGNTTSFSFTQGDVTSSFINRERGNYWQFPVLGTIGCQVIERHLAAFALNVVDEVARPLALVHIGGTLTGHLAQGCGQFELAKEVAGLL